MRILGLDPGLEHTGYGVLEVRGNAYTFVAAGRVSTKPSQPLPERLAVLAAGLQAVVAEYRPAAAAVEEVFVNKNMQSSLKLAQARAISLLIPTQAGVPVHEYAARLVKQSLVGKGNAEKAQVAHMVGVLLPACRSQALPPDATDALAAALTHAHHAGRLR
ncbi:MAG: crossover junction endodeoxyribonuclease RuvC [Alphaproteobacteria bacterium]|nr:crossover junction endodeoxyribonuclease RuvC [Alphaproteobacteria bacterium]